MRDLTEWASGLAKPSDALRTDIGWIREHTRLGELAADWERGNRADELQNKGNQRPNSA